MQWQAVHDGSGPVSTAYLGLVVLQPVGLVHHEAGPLDGAQDGLVNGDELVGCEQDVEFDLHFFLEEKRGLSGQSWEASGSRSPETEVRRTHGQEPPGTPGNPCDSEKTLANEQRVQPRPRALTIHERGAAENGATAITTLRTARAAMYGTGCVGQVLCLVLTYTSLMLTSQSGYVVTVPSYIQLIRSWAG